MATKKNSSKKSNIKKVETTLVETQTAEQPKINEPDGVYVDAQGEIKVSERLKQQAQEAIAKEEAREHKKYNKIQSLRVFNYEVYYGDASHEPGHHGDKQKEFKNLQTAINWIAKEAKFFVEEGIERECYSIVLNDVLIAEY